MSSASGNFVRIKASACFTSEEEDLVAGEETAGDDTRESEADIYIAERLVDRQKCPQTGKWKYLVAWKGYPGEDTWEPEGNIFDKGLIVEFKRRLKTSKKKSSKQFIGQSLRTPSDVGKLGLPKKFENDRPSQPPCLKPVTAFPAHKNISKKKPESLVEMPTLAPQSQPNPTDNLGTDKTDPSKKKSGKDRARRRKKEKSTVVACANEAGAEVEGSKPVNLTLTELPDLDDALNIEPGSDSLTNFLEEHDIPWLCRVAATFKATIADFFGCVATIDDTVVPTHLVSVKKGDTLVRIKFPYNGCVSYEAMRRIILFCTDVYFKDNEKLIMGQAEISLSGVRLNARNQRALYKELISGYSVDPLRHGDNYLTMELTTESQKKAPFKLVLAAYIMSGCLTPAQT